MEKKTIEKRYIPLEISLGWSDDGDVYRVRKKNGRVTLSDEDVDVINTYICRYSGRMLYSSNINNDEEYIGSLWKDEKKIEELAKCNIAVFNLLASSLDIESETLRRYPEDLMYFDDVHDIEDEGYLEMRKEYCGKLLDNLYPSALIVPNRGKEV